METLIIVSLLILQSCIAFAQYCTPKKHRLRYLLSITFKEPGAVFIRGNKTGSLVRRII